MVCLSGVSPPLTHNPHPISQQHRHNTQESEGEEVLSGPRSQRRDLFLNTKCGRGPEE